MSEVAGRREEKVKGRKWFNGQSWKNIGTCVCLRQSKRYLKQL